jgi:hypothetical protein
MTREPADRGTDTGQQSDGAAATARAARERVAELSSAEGRFAVACRETGRRPAPVADAVFDSYGDAERARDAAREYRTAMRRVDPDLTEFTLAVCHADDRRVAVTARRESTDERRANGLPRASQTATVAGERTGEWLRVSNAPVVHLTGRGEALDDEFVSRQLRSKLRY